MLQTNCGPYLYHTPSCPCLWEKLLLSLFLPIWLAAQLTDVLFAGDKLKLEAEEEKVDAEIEQKLKVRQEELAKAGGRGQRKRSAPQKKDVASSNQVAAACGERLQPSNDQASKVKQLAKNKKTAAAAQKSAHVSKCILFFFFFK